MIVYHTAKETAVNLAEALARHSADLMVPYKEANGRELVLALFLPPAFDAKKQHPTFVMVHGGGWTSRKIFTEQSCWQGDYLGYLARYYADLGFVSVSVDYRLVADQGQRDGAGLLDACGDCRDAVIFLRTHAQAYGVDPERMYLLGESAGGYLAAAIDIFPSLRCGGFAAVFLAYPITDLSLEPWRDFVPKGTSERTLSPAAQGSGSSPTVLFHGGADTVVSPEHALRLYENRNRAGQACTLHLFPDETHAFLLPEYYRGGLDACETTIGIINEIVGVPAESKGAAP